jgi:hypothetical protein
MISNYAWCLQNSIGSKLDALASLFVPNVGSLPGLEGSPKKSIDVRIVIFKNCLGFQTFSKMI